MKIIIFLVGFFVFETKVFCQLDSSYINSLHLATKYLEKPAIERLSRKFSNYKKDKLLSLPFVRLNNTEAILQKNILFDTSKVGIVLFGINESFFNYYSNQDTNFFFNEIDERYDYDKVANLISSQMCLILSPIFNFFIQIENGRTNYITFDGKTYQTFDSIVFARFGSNKKFLEELKYSEYNSKILKDNQLKTVEDAHKVISKSWHLKCKYYTDDFTIITKAFVCMVKDALNINEVQEQILKASLNEQIQFVKDNPRRFKVPDKFNISDISLLTPDYNYFYKHVNFRNGLVRILTQEELNLFDMYFYLFCHNLCDRARDIIAEDCRKRSVDTDATIKEMVRKSVKSLK